MSAFGVAVLLYAAYLVGFAALLLVRVRAAERCLHRLREEGLPAEAYIRRSRPSTWLREDVYRDIWAKFQTEQGESVEAKLSVSAARRDEAAPGNTVTIRYLADNPRACMLEGDEGFATEKARTVRRALVRMVWHRGVVLVLLVLGGLLAAKVRTG